MRLSFLGQVLRQCDTSTHSILTDIVTINVLTIRVVTVRIERGFPPVINSNYSRDGF